MKIIASEVSTYNEAIHELVELRDVLKTQYIQSGFNEDKTNVDLNQIGKQVSRVLTKLDRAIKEVDEKIEFIQDHTENIYGW